MFVLDDVSRIRNEAEACWTGLRGKAAGVRNCVPPFVEVTYSGVQVKGNGVGMWLRKVGLVLAEMEGK